MPRDNLCLRVEIEYPMLWESQDQGWDPIVIEPNVFVDTVLDLVYKHCGNRKITFSSFSPEICILLAAKQQEFPILFLNKAGAVPTGDVRASSTQQAVHFARRWDLNGVVLLSDPLVVCPRLIQHVKSKGLICASYGDLNDDPVNAKVDFLLISQVGCHTH